PTAGVAKVFVPRAGTITAVHVREGQEVEGGQPLLTVAIDQTTSDGQNVDVVLLETLARQKHALVEQITMQEGRSVSEGKRLEAQIAGARSEIAHLEEQIAVQRERAQLAESLVSSIEGLRANRYISEVEYKRRRETHLENRQNLGALGQ